MAAAARVICRQRRSIAVLIGLAVVIAALIWIARPPLSIEAILPARELRIGVDPSHPPFAFTEGGALTGLDIAIGNALAAELGVTPRYVLLGFDGLYDALKIGQIDVLLAGLTVDPARSGLAHYSPPYFNAGMLLVSDAARPIPDMTAISGLQLALEFGSEADAEARRWLRRVAPFTIRPYERPAIALDAARLGDADAALVDAITARLYLRDHPTWRAHTAYVTVLPIAAATNAGRGDLAAAVDRAMTALFADGTIDAFIAEWLGEGRTVAYRHGRAHDALPRGRDQHHHSRHHRRVRTD
jgi:ABC-type amino acid transport substrate-binding protein